MSHKAKAQTKKRKFKINTKSSTIQLEAIPKGATTSNHVMVGTKSKLNIFMSDHTTHD